MKNLNVNGEASSRRRESWKGPLGTHRVLTIYGEIRRGIFIKWRGPFRKGLTKAALRLKKRFFLRLARTSLLKTENSYLKPKNRFCSFKSTIAKRAMY